MSNEIFAHEYPDDPELQAAMLNKAFMLADDLLLIFNKVKDFSTRYV